MDNSIPFEGESKRVLITGFAPFSGLDPNPSWEGVQSISKDRIESKYNIRLIQEKVEVRYRHIDHSVPKLWDKHQPNLTIHVGVSDQAPCLLLETQAYKCGYNEKDLDGFCPENNQNSADGPESIVADLDIHAVVESFNSGPPADELQVEVSNDAGRYLCEYIYYTSLCQGTSKTLFVHVPFEKYSSEQIAQGLERILEICLCQLRLNEEYI